MTYCHLLYVTDLGCNISYSQPHLASYVHEWVELFLISNGVLNSQKNRFTTALSHQAPTLPIYARMPYPFSNVLKCLLVYCESRSLWNTSPKLGCLRFTALISALLNKSVVMCFSICHPTIRREYKSITIARYIQPSAVFK